MKTVNHINYMDQEGQVYCCLRNKVVKLDEQQREQFCKGCSMFAGHADGRGVECVWEDSRHISEPFIVLDPTKEFIRNQVRHVSSNYMSSIVLFCG